MSLFPRPSPSKTNRRVPQNELIRADRLGLVAGTGQRREMPIFGDDEICSVRYGTVGEQIVVRIVADNKRSCPLEFGPGCPDDFRQVLQPVRLAIRLHVCGQLLPHAFFLNIQENFVQPNKMSPPASMSSLRRMSRSHSRPSSWVGMGFVFMAMLPTFQVA